MPTPAQPTLHGTLHNLSPTIIGLALIAACFVFARRFLRSAGLRPAGRCWTRGHPA
ncbi:hypothetical protein [Nonomuraea sp. LPB2021202275-12-8]|uniref:hypothetical protein n=1 Tax=Nonomuraea sp. LPB2021202275-12-8 TaxID=3120159 RepID=UPI00300D8595